MFFTYLTLDSPPSRDSGSLFKRKNLAQGGRITCLTHCHCEVAGDAGTGLVVTTPKVFNLPCCLLDEHADSFEKLRKLVDHMIPR